MGRIKGFSSESKKHECGVAEHTAKTSLSSGDGRYAWCPPEMGTITGFTAGCLAGVGMALVGYGLDTCGLVTCLHSIVGLGLLVGGAIFAFSEATPIEAKPSGSLAGVDAERYAQLLSKLELLRIRQNLPETVYVKLQEEYVQRLRTALEEETKVH
ncbi:MAG: hypothetical protein ABSG74_09725 [Candidatus Bathyarchaeia archaeon]